MWTGCDPWALVWGPRNWESEVHRRLGNVHGGSLQANERSSLWGNIHEKRISYDGELVGDPRISGLRFSPCQSYLVVHEERKKNSPVRERRKFGNHCTGRLSCRLELRPAERLIISIDKSFSLLPVFERISKAPGIESLQNCAVTESPLRRSLERAIPHLRYQEKVD